MSYMVVIIFVLAAVAMVAAAKPGAEAPQRKDGVLWTRDLQARTCGVRIGGEWFCVTRISLVRI